MKKQIWMEYRKLWNKIAGVAVIAMCVVAVLHLFVYLNLQYRSIDGREKLWRVWHLTGHYEKHLKNWRSHGRGVYTEPDNQLQ